ncbi:sugar lactone lactonase YvrE [Mesorhizobium sp. J18]|uniref:SMP-30/gluconolactonase/LRE family protein n=1 Tax=Mesorhizobium sp. J18 TaxID=935263 RepID=UPI00119935A3|nr:SMP-30/gluconolactonase/LRE family protein [Mesorhizobium sp. J18]TWG92125.1 sugar lactone lactonase YvrE [Mesorhizobium sp. J18]
MTTFATVDAPACVLGEGPIWSDRDDALYWVDVVAKLIFRFRPSGGEVAIRELPFAPSAIVPRKTGGLLLVTKKGMAILDSFEGALQSIAVPLIDFTREVFNDAACDQAGRLWIGTRDINAREAKGRLYRIDADFDVTVHAEGLVISNGIAWSPDGRTMYHVDSRPGRIDAYDYDPDRGAISARRVFLDYDQPGTAGHPDGCTVDAEGGLWVAEVEGARLARYTPDGRLDREVPLPVSKPTSVMFGGPGLRTLFATSMQFRLSQSELAEQHLAGRLFALDVGVAGLPEPLFAGTRPAVPAVEIGANAPRATSGGTR